MLGFVPLLWFPVRKGELEGFQPWLMLMCPVRWGLRGLSVNVSGWLGTIDSSGGGGQNKQAKKDPNRRE